MIPLHWMLGIGSLSQLIGRPCVMSIDAAAVLPRADPEPPHGAWTAMGTDSRVHHGLPQFRVFPVPPRTLLRIGPGFTRPDGAEIPCRKTAQPTG